LPDYRTPRPNRSPSVHGYGRAKSYAEGGTPRSRRSLTPTGSIKDTSMQPPPPSQSLADTLAGVPSHCARYDSTFLIIRHGRSAHQHGRPKDISLLSCGWLDASIKSSYKLSRRHWRKLVCIVLSKSQLAASGSCSPIGPTLGLSLMLHCASPSQALHIAKCLMVCLQRLRQHLNQSPALSQRQQLCTHGISRGESSAGSAPSHW